jgi:hypothetical protein
MFYLPILTLVEELETYFHQVRLTNNTEVQFTAALCRKLIFFIHYTHAFFVPFCIFT